MINAKRIADAVKQGPATVGGIAHRLEAPSMRVSSAVLTAINRRVIITIGTLFDAEAAGLAVELGPHTKRIRKDALIYAAPGTPKLPVAKRAQAVTERPKGKRAPYITIGRGFRWGASLV